MRGGVDSAQEAHNANCLTPDVESAWRQTRGYLGNEPGVMEEAKLALEYRKPLYLMGGFGGAAREFGESEHHSATEYWRSRNGLRYDHKRELFETTDMECALRLISGGIGRFDPELDFLGVGLEA